MKTEDKKAALSAYKERKTIAGLYALCCIPTGQRWIGRAPDVETIENRIRFALRLGTTPHRDLQAAIREHGEAAFTFEIVERLEEKDMELGRDRILKARQAHWCEELHAKAI